MRKTGTRKRAPPAVDDEQSAAVTAPGVVQQVEGESGGNDAAERQPQQQGKQAEQQQQQQEAEADTQMDAVSATSSSLSAVGVQDASGQAAYLESLLEDDVYQYDAHLQLVSLLRAQGEVDALRQARERMARYFALPAELWLQWLEDEKSRVDDEAGQRSILALYLRACSDYLVPRLWLDCIDFAEQLLYDEEAVRLRGKEEPDSLQELRELMAAAATATSCHRLAGESVMKKLRAFEMRVLRRLLQLLQQEKQAHGDDDDDADVHDEQEDEEDVSGGSSAVNESSRRQMARCESRVMRQVRRVKALYERSLSQPVLGLEQAYSEYQHWCEQQQDAVEDGMTRLFKESKAERDRRTPHEKAVSEASVDSSASSGILSMERLQAWLSYIDYEKQRSESSRPERVVVLYERALCVCFLHADVWLAYVEFMRNRLLPPAALIQLHRRAVRNVPRCGELWCGLVRAIGQRDMAEPVSQLDSILDDGLAALQGKAGSGGGGSAVVALCSAALICKDLQCSFSHPLSRWPPSLLFTTAERAIRYCDAASSLQPRHVDICIDLFTFWYRWGDRTAARAAMTRWVKEQVQTSRTWSALLRLEEEVEEDIIRSTYPTAIDGLLAANDPGVETLCHEWMRYTASRSLFQDYDVAARRCELVSLQMDSLRSQAAGAAVSALASQPAATGQPSSRQESAEEQQQKGNRKERRSRQKPQRDEAAQGKADKERKKKKRKPESDVAAAAEEALSSEQATASADEQAKGKQKKRRQQVSERQPEEKEETKAADAATTSPAARVDVTALPMAEEILETASGASAMAEESAGKGEKTSGEEEEHRVEHPTRTLLVSKLPADATEATLIAAFAKYGQIELVKLLPDSSGAAAGGRRAYVVYSSKDAIKPALAAQGGEQADGSGLQVDAVSHLNKRLKQQQRAQQPRPLSVFLRSLPPLADPEAAIRRHFAACGAIARVWLVRDRDGQLRNVAYVEFTQREAAEKAMRMDGQLMEGAAIGVGPDLPLAVRQQQQQQRRGREREEARAGAATGSGVGNAQHVRLGVIGRQMGRLQLIPRTLQTSAAASSRKDTAAAAAEDSMEDDEDAATAATDSAPPAPVKSNSDFRALLLRKS